jgi:hypothetical protein
MNGELFQSDWLERSFQIATPQKNYEQNPQNMKLTKILKLPAP